MSAVPLRKRHIDHRGDQMPNIVQKMQLGRTTVLISDAFLPKTDEELEAAKQHVVNTHWDVWHAMTEEEQLEFNAKVV